MTDNDCEKIIELCWWHLATCKLADCIIDSVGECKFTTLFCLLKRHRFDTM